MIDLKTVNWRRDWITERYVEAHREELVSPETMDVHDLGAAVTYCTTIRNPYAVEIMRRSGHLEAYREAWTARDRARIFQKACRYHGMMIL